jgi:hypothetical protein
MANRARTIRLNEFQRDTCLAAVKAEMNKVRVETNSPATLKRLALEMLTETAEALEALDYGGDE